jgi:hypothetical protein
MSVSTRIAPHLRVVQPDEIAGVFIEDGGVDPLFADYGEVTEPRSSKAKHQERRGSQEGALRSRHVGIPFGFIADVVSRTRGRHALLLALHVFRRSVVQRSKTIRLVSAELSEWRVDRKEQSRALAALEAAGLVVTVRAPGRKTVVTLCWPRGGSGSVAWARQ